MAVFLWQEGNIPFELEENTIPGSSDIGLADMGSMENIDSLIISHPLFVQSQLKLNDLEVQRRLQSEMLKPELNLKYNALSGAAAYEDPLYNNNYTFGLQFSMPLFLRKERGDLRMTKVKLQQGTQDLDNKKAEINAKINMAMNELNTNRQLISLQEQTVENYNNLLIGEKSLFNGGESSLFMVNSREMNFIQSQLKLNALLSKQFIAQLKLAYALGTLNETI
jgi:outer membrane protein TolC